MTDWKCNLDAKDRARAVVLIELLERAGLDNAEGWVRSEIQEGVAQAARAFFLRTLWPTLIDVYLKPEWIDRMIAHAQRNPGRAFVDAGLALERLRSDGAADEDIGRVARAVAYETVFNLLYHVDEGYDVEFEDAPGWRLMEVDPEGERLTGRDVGALHESILSMDPSGREGSPE